MTTKEQIQRLAREIVRMAQIISRLKRNRDESFALQLETSSKLAVALSEKAALSDALAVALEEKLALSLKLDTSNASLIEALSNDKADSEAIAAAIKSTEDQQAITASLIVKTQEVTDELAAKSAESEALRTSLESASVAAAEVAAAALALEAEEIAELEALVTAAEAIVE